MKAILSTIFVFAFLVNGFSQEKEVSYTLADRDKLIQVETKVEALDDKIDRLDATLTARMDRMESKFDTYFTWGFGMVLGAIFALFGFILWDRCSTIAPVKWEQKPFETLVNQTRRFEKYSKGLHCGN